MTDARSVTLALRGRWCGTYGIARCPVPGHGQGHGDRRPSLSVRDGELPGRVLFRCHAGCDGRDVFHELRARGLIGCDAPAGIRQRRPVAPRIPAEPEPDRAALILWQRGERINGTFAARYLRDHRCISTPLPPSLRYRADVRYPHAGTILPALVAAVQRPDRIVAAVHLVFLRPTDGAKARVYAPKISVGGLGTGAVRLAPAGQTLGLAEGIETALSAMEMTGVPCWATLGAQRLPRITLPDCVRRVVLFADRDAPGELHAGLAATAYSAQGRAVEIRWPPNGAADWNDALRAQRGAE